LPPAKSPVETSLVLVGHGSRDPGAGAVLRNLREAVAARLAPVNVTLAWIELDDPLVADVVPLTGDPATVVVPLLLSRGTHVTRDLPTGAREPLGPDHLLTQMLMDRLREAEVAPGRPLVLAATGSTDPAGIDDVNAQAKLLEAAWGAPVRAGFVTAEPSIAAAVEQLSTAGAAAPAVVSYFLAPGRLPEIAGADTAHLGDHPALVELVLMRYQGVAPVGVTRMGL
jgi:sirohydrochlorin ferrochelatase